MLLVLAVEGKKLRGSKESQVLGSTGCRSWSLLSCMGPGTGEERVQKGAELSAAGGGVTACGEGS